MSVTYTVIKAIASLGGRHTSGYFFLVITTEQKPYLNKSLSFVLFTHIVWSYVVVSGDYIESEYSKKT